jgi:hypothetical protein
MRLGTWVRNKLGATSGGCNEGANGGSMCMWVRAVQVMYMRRCMWLWLWAYRWT